MKGNIVKGQFVSGRDEHNVETAIFIFEDEANWFYYAPALDLTGYGKTKEEAENSFTTALVELMRYTINKGTTKQMLVDLGWTFDKVSKKNKRLKAPQLHELLMKDTYLQEIFDTKDFSKFNKTVEIPAFA